MKVIGKQIQRFELYEPIVLAYKDGEYTWYEPESNEDFDSETLLDPGTFLLKELYVDGKKGELGLNYIDEDIREIRPEFDIRDLLRLEKDNLIKFIEED